MSSQTFYHGTKADLKPGDLIEPGFNSNCGQRKKAKEFLATGAEIYLGNKPEVAKEHH